MPRVLCPACGKSVAVKGIPKHTNGCPEWARKIGVPPSEFNFDAHFKRRLYAEGAVEGADYVVCRLCPDVRKKRLADHLKIAHGLTTREYRERFPEAPTAARRTTQKRQETVQARYGVDNVSKLAETKEKTRETSLERYGVEHPSQAPEVREQRAVTNLARYGHENPFGSKEVQEGIRQTHLDRRGVENPNQDPEVVARRIATNRERYGEDHYLQTEDFKERFREGCRKKWGTDHHMQSEEGSEANRSAMKERWGVENPLQSPEVQRRAYETNLANHGGVHSQQCPEVLLKARATWLEKYGVDNPSKCEEVKARIKAVWMGKYGVPFPPQSLWTNRTQSFPNKLEQSVDKLSPARVVYAGDGSYWVQYKGASKVRNPDFVVLKPDQLKAYLGGADLNGLRTSAVIEVFGDYWHGPAKTGESRARHKYKVEEYYRRCGIVCLVLWETEVKGHPKRVGERIQRFLLEWAAGTLRKGKGEGEGNLIYDLFLE